MTSYLFHGGRFLDPRKDELQDGISVLVEDGLVKEVCDRPITSIRPPASTCAAAR